MSKASTRKAWATLAGATVGSTALLLGIGLTPAAAAHTTVTGLQGSGFGYFSSVSLFGGAPATRGPAPTLTLPAGSPAGPVTASAAAPTGSVVYGPATLFTSGPISLTSEGTLGATGGVTTTATVETINTSGQEVFTATSVSGTCTASATGASGSTTVVGGLLETSEGNPDVDGDEVVVPIPTNPAPNTSFEGVIEGVGDSFRYVFNEQITNPDGSFTVNAAHLYLIGPTAIGDLIIGQVVCGVTTAPLPHDNVAPVAADDSYSMISGTLTVGAPGVLGNDTDANGDALTAGSATDPANGSITLNPDGSFAYTPDTGSFVGADTFTYTVTDAGGATDTATVTIHVGNSPPIARDDAYSALLGTPLNVPAATGVLSNDFDFQRDTLTAGSATDPAHGTVTLNPDGSFTYTADVGFAGLDTFTYAARDEVGASATATVTVTVSSTPPNRPPDAVNNGYRTLRNVPLIVPAPGVLGNDTDPDGDTLTVISATLRSSAFVGDSLTVNPDGSFTYTPEPGAIGSTAFTYVVSDGHGGTDNGFVSLTVDPDPRECGSKIPTIFGTEGDDTIRGTDGPDVISGLGGNDTIKGLGGDDSICGGAGDDNIDGGDGNDSIEGGDGNDRLRGGDGDDFIDGGAGDDDYDGGAGNDFLFDVAGTSRIKAGPGDDGVFTFEGNNVIDLGSGIDSAFTGAGDDTIDGGSGDDGVFAGEGNDTVNGGSGDDFLLGQGGDDLIIGGPGDDTIAGDDFEEQGFDTCDPGKTAPGMNTYEFCNAGAGATPPP